MEERMEEKEEMGKKKNGTMGELTRTCKEVSFLCIFSHHAL